MRLSDTLIALGAAAAAVSAAEPPTASDTFHESLTLHPLPDGKLSVLFQFTTHFDLHTDEDGERIGELRSSTLFTSSADIQSSHITR